MHAHDATDRNDTIAEWGGKNGQRYRRAHELGARSVGDAFGLGDAPRGGGTEPERPVRGERWQHHGQRQHHGRRDRYDEGEDALDDWWTPAGASS